MVIINLKVVLKEFLGLANLLKTQNFYIHKATKIFMICKNKYLILAIF